MKQIIYTVRAVRWGDNSKHSYIVGVYSKKQKALDVAEIEEKYRGTKYSCEVVELYLNDGMEDGKNAHFKVVKELEKLL